jgi:hypothetical protein
VVWGPREVNLVTVVITVWSVCHEKLIWLLWSLLCGLCATRSSVGYCGHYCVVCVPREVHLVTVVITVWSGGHENLIWLLGHDCVVCVPRGELIWLICIMLGVVYVPREN